MLDASAMHAQSVLRRQIRRRYRRVSDGAEITTIRESGYFVTALDSAGEPLHLSLERLGALYERIES